MKNKLLLAVITSQSFVMLGLIYFLWGRDNNEFILNENFLFFLVIFSLSTFLLGLNLYSKDSKKFEKAVRLEGKVKWYSSSKGFGFIEQNQGEDLFVHQTEIMQSGFRYLNLGDHVEYEVGKGKKGPVALKVIRTKIAESDDSPDNFLEPEEYPITQASETQ